VAAAGAIAWLYLVLTAPLFSSVQQLLYGGTIGLTPVAASRLAFNIYIVATVLCGVGTYGILTYGRRAATPLETRCRKCNYILRGISEPRCPECGERI